MEAYALFTVESPLKKPAQMLCPKPMKTRTGAIKAIDNFTVTPIACFASITFPAPSSFETRVLSYKGLIKLD